LVLLWLSYSILKIGISLYNTLSDTFLKAFVLGATAAFFSQLLAAGLGDNMLPAYHNAGYTRFGTTVYTWVCAGAIVAVQQFSRHDRHTAHGEN
jgi:tellurite resistance protein TehA-like permease